MTPVKQWAKHTIYTCQRCGKLFGRRARPSVEPVYCSHQCVAAIGREAAEKAKVRPKPKTAAQVYAEMKEMMK